MASVPIVRLDCRVYHEKFSMRYVSLFTSSPITWDLISCSSTQGFTSLGGVALSDNGKKRCPLLAVGHFDAMDAATVRRRSSDWECGLCGKRFLSRPTLWQHFTLRHKNHILTAQVSLPHDKASVRWSLIVKKIWIVPELKKTGDSHDDRWRN